MNRFNPLNGARFNPLQQRYATFLLPSYGKKAHFFTSILPTHKYYERRLVGYSQHQMYKIVSQVQHYHLFVPWCLESNIHKTRIINENSKLVWAELKVGFQQLQESYTSRVNLVENEYVEANSNDSSVFDTLKNTWVFKPRPDILLSTNSGNLAEYPCCELKFHVEFRFKSILYNQASDVFLNKVANKMVGAFEKRALELYGKPSIPSRKIY